MFTICLLFLGRNISVCLSAQVCVLVRLYAGVFIICVSVCVCLCLLVSGRMFVFCFLLFILIFRFLSIFCIKFVSFFDITFYFPLFNFIPYYFSSICFLFSTSFFWLFLNSFIFRSSTLTEYLKFFFVFYSFSYFLALNILFIITNYFSLTCNIFSMGLHFLLYLFVPSYSFTY